MRRLVAAVAAGLLTVCVSATSHAQVLVYEVFGAYLDSLRTQAGIPGLAAAIVDNEEIAWERAYGFQNVAQSIATRTDTPFNADGLTQTITAALVLRCVEERRLALDDRIGSFPVAAPEPNATVRQLLTHTSGATDTPVYSLQPERLQPLQPIVRICATDSYREKFAQLLGQLGMYDSVPGPNILGVKKGDEGVPHPNDMERYKSVLQRRATPYRIDGRRRAIQSSYAASAELLTPSSGLVTTVRDLAKFDIELQKGRVVRADTLAEAWTAPVGSGGPLPHGVGWFVQRYNGEKVVWQFGMEEGASSSFIIRLENRGLTLIVMANSDGLLRLYSPADGDITLSPFAKLFLNLFVR
jgi:CubicO group peptidase (beta-lactamase class C family)